MGVGERRWCGREEGEWVKGCSSWRELVVGWGMAEVFWAVGEKVDGEKVLWCEEIQLRRWKVVMLLRKWRSGGVGLWKGLAKGEKGGRRELRFYRRRSKGNSWTARAIRAGKVSSLGSVSGALSMMMGLKTNRG